MVGFLGKVFAPHGFLDITIDIEHYSALKHHTFAVFLDITKAQDVVQPRLVMTGVCAHIFICVFLRDCHIRLSWSSLE